MAITVADGASATTSVRYAVERKAEYSVDPIAPVLSARATTTIQIHPARCHDLGAELAVDDLPPRDKGAFMALFNHSELAAG